MCDQCPKFENTKIANFKKQVSQKAKMTTVPAKPNAPTYERLKLTMQTYRIDNKNLKKQTEQFQEEISKSSLPVSTVLNNDFVSIISDADQSKISPFMKLFWEEQQKHLKTSSSGVRYHPMIIRYCLSLASKSVAIYDDI